MVVFFGVLLLVQAWQGLRLKTYAYMGCVVSGCILQMVGYGGRIMLHANPFDFNAFLMQISECARWKAVGKSEKRD